MIRSYHSNDKYKISALKTRNHLKIKQKWQYNLNYIRLRCQRRKKNKTRYHARPVSFETVNTEKLAYRIHDRSTLRVSDIISTLEELKNEVAQCLLEGKKVHVDGLGFFQVTLSCEEEIRNPKDKRVHRVKLKAIKFKADKELKGELCHMKFQRSKIRPHSANLSEVEMRHETN